MLTFSEKRIVKRLREILQCFVPYHDRLMRPGDARHEVVLPAYVQCTRRYRVFLRWVYDAHDAATPRVRYDIEAMHAEDIDSIPLHMTETYRFRKHEGALVFNVCGKGHTDASDHLLQWSVTQKMHGCAIQYVMFELRTVIVQTLIENIISIYCPRGFGVKCEFISTGTDVLNMTLHSDYDMTLNALHKTSHLIAVYHRILKKLFKGRTSIEMLDNNLFGHSFMQTHMRCHAHQDKKCEKSQVIAPHWQPMMIGPREFIVPRVYNAYQYCREQESWALLRFYVHARELVTHPFRHDSARRMSSRQLSRKVSGHITAHREKIPLAWSSTLDHLRAITIWPRLHLDVRVSGAGEDADADACSFREHLDTAEKFYQANTLVSTATKYVERMRVYEKLRYSIEDTGQSRRRTTPVHPYQFTVLSHMNYFGDETYFSAAPLLHVVGMMMLIGKRGTKDDKIALVKTADGHVMWDSFLHSMVENASYWIYHILDESGMQVYRRMTVPQMRREMLFRYAKYLLRFFDALWMHSSFRPCTPASAQLELKKLVKLLRYIKKEIYNHSNTVIQLRLKVSDCEQYKQGLYDRVLGHIACVVGCRQPQPSITWLVHTVSHMLEKRCGMAITKESLLPTEVPKLCQSIREHARLHPPTDSHRAHKTKAKAKTAKAKTAKAKTAKAKAKAKTKTATTKTATTKTATTKTATTKTAKTKTAKTTAANTTVAKTNVAKTTAKVTAQTHHRGRGRSGARMGKNHT